MVLFASPVDEPAVRRKYNANIQEAYQRFMLAIAPAKERFNRETRRIEVEYAVACDVPTKEYLKASEEALQAYRKEVGFSQDSTAQNVVVD